MSRELGRSGGEALDLTRGVREDDGGWRTFQLGFASRVGVLARKRGWGTEAGNGVG